MTLDFHLSFKAYSPLYDFVFSYSQNSADNYRKIRVENAKRLSFGCDQSIHN